MVHNKFDHLVFDRHSSTNLCIYLVVYVDDMIYIFIIEVIRIPEWYSGFQATFVYTTLVKTNDLDYISVRVIPHFAS